MHVPPFDSVRSQAGKPAGIAGQQGGPDSAPHVQRNRPIHHPPVARACKPPGFVVPLYYLCFLGHHPWSRSTAVPVLLKRVTDQFKVPTESWDEYEQREQTRHKHLVELQYTAGIRGVRP